MLDPTPTCAPSFNASDRAKPIFAEKRMPILALMPRSCGCFDPSGPTNRLRLSNTPAFWFVDTAAGTPGGGASSDARSRRGLVRHTVVARITIGRARRGCANMNNSPKIVFPFVEVMPLDGNLSSATERLALGGHR